MWKGGLKGILQIHCRTPFTAPSNHPSVPMPHTENKPRAPPPPRSPVRSVQRSCRVGGRTSRVSPPFSRYVSPVLSNPGYAYRFTFLSQRHLEILHYIMSYWWLQEYNQIRVSWMAPSWMLVSMKTKARLTVLPTPICCGSSLLSLHLAPIALPKK